MKSINRKKTTEKRRRRILTPDELVHLSATSLQIRVQILDILSPGWARHWSSSVEILQRAGNKENTFRK